MLSIPNRRLRPTKRLLLVDLFNDAAEVIKGVICVNSAYVCRVICLYRGCPCVLDIFRDFDQQHTHSTMRVSTLSLFTSSAAASALLPVPNLRDLVPGGNSPNPSSSGFKLPTFHRSNGGGAVCVSGTVPVTATTKDNIKLDISVPKNQSEVTEFFVAAYSAGSTVAEDINDGKQTVSGTWNIYATLCTPEKNLKPKGVQLLTHGVGVSPSPFDN